MSEIVRGHDEDISFSLALSCQNRYEQAVEAYKKALELDPNQESFKNNLKIAEEKVKELEAAAQASGVPPVIIMLIGNHIWLLLGSKWCSS